MPHYSLKNKKKKHSDKENQEGIKDRTTPNGKGKLIIQENITIRMEQAARILRELL